MKLEAARGLAVQARRLYASRRDSWQARHALRDRLGVCQRHFRQQPAN